MAERASRQTEDGDPRWLGLRFGSKQATHGIYIEIVLLAVILALESKRPSDRDIVSSVVGAIVVVVLADLYAYYVGSMTCERRSAFLTADGRWTAWSRRVELVGA